MARIPVMSQEAAFRIFATLNDRGLRLSPPDLLLSHLMEKAPENERKDVRAIWTEMVQKMGTHDIDEFLRAMWVSRFGDLKDDLFTALKTYLEEHKIASRDFARVCADECDDYQQLVTADETQLPKDSHPFVRALTRELGVKSAVPLLLSGYALFQQSDFEKLTKFLLVFITRYSIIGNKELAGMENLLFKLAREVRSLVKDENDKSGSQHAVSYIKDQFMLYAPDDDAVKKPVVLETTTLGNSEAKYVMNRLAIYRQDPEKQIAMGEANLEHIYPQNPSADEWGGEGNQEKLEPLTWHIGNLTIFGKRANRKAANSEYGVKRPRFQESKVLMTSDVAATYDHWDEKTILNRAAALAKSVVQVWKFDNPSRV
jgi:hypothetical protein